MEFLKKWLKDELDQDEGVQEVKQLVEGAKKIDEIDKQGLDKWLEGRFTGWVIGLFKKS